MPFILDALNNIFSRKEKCRIESNFNQQRNIRQKPISTSIRCYPFRFGPGVELISTLNELMKDLQIDSLFVISCIGDICHCSLNNRVLKKKEYEVLTLNGSLNRENYSLTGSFVDLESGVIHGGKVTSLTVSKSLELILAETIDCKLSRQFDPRTNQFELNVKRKILTDF